MAAPRVSISCFARSPVRAQHYSVSQSSTMPSSSAKPKPKPAIPSPSSRCAEPPYNTALEILPKLLPLTRRKCHPCLAEE